MGILDKYTDISDIRDLTDNLGNVIQTIKDKKAETMRKAIAKMEKYPPLFAVLGKALLEAGEAPAIAQTNIHYLHKMFKYEFYEQNRRNVQDELVLAFDEIKKLQKKGIIGEKFEILNPYDLLQSKIITESLGISENKFNLQNTSTLKKYQNSADNLFTKQENAR